MDFMSWSEGLSDGVKNLVRPSVPLNVTVPNKAVGYREVGVFYTCIPDPAYPWDPAIMRQILEFAPDAIPMWVRWVFLDDTDHTVIYGRHALGRHIRGLRNPPHEFECSMPSMPCQGLEFKQPNIIWFIHEGPSLKGENAAIPGEYMAFDRTLLWKARQSSLGFTMSDKEYKEHLWQELVDKPRARFEAKQRAHAEDMEARRREIGPYILKQLWKEWQMSEKDVDEVFFNNAGPTPE
jgi:hypothetical protein